LPLLNKGAIATSFHRVGNQASVIYVQDMNTNYWTAVYNNPRDIVKSSRFRISQHLNGFAEINSEDCEREGMSIEQWLI
jgi:hypothetical protein